jgi:hypothetical protein
MSPSADFLVTIKSLYPNRRRIQNVVGNDLGQIATLNSYFLSNDTTDIVKSFSHPGEHKLSTIPMSYSHGDSTTTNHADVKAIDRKVNFHLLNPDDSSKTGSPSINSGIQTYLQRAFSNVRPSGGSVDQVSFPNISISDKYHLQTNLNQPIPTNLTVHDNLLGPPIKSAIIVSMVRSPHFPQLFPRNLALIAHRKYAINEEYTTSPTTRNQFVTQNLMTSTLPVFTKFHKKQIPFIGSNYALSTTNHTIRSFDDTSESNLDFSLPVMNSSNLHHPSTALSVYVPKSIMSISKSPTPEKWTSALENEISSLISQNVFDPTPIDISTIDKTLIIPSRVIFDTRLNADGSINKYKARLVAQGNYQDSSTFFDTFADTASARSINVLLSLAAAENYEMASIDVKTAFLYSPIKETIYLKRPPGLSPHIMPPIVKLNKCLYGLRQAAHEWRNLLDTTLKTMGFSQFKTDACIYKINKSINTLQKTLILQTQR